MRLFQSLDHLILKEMSKLFIETVFFQPMDCNEEPQMIRSGGDICILHAKNLRQKNMPGLCQYVGNLASAVSTVTYFPGQFRRTES